MAVICPQCNTENRDVAKFCIECVCTLPTLLAKLDFAATVPAGLKALRWKSPRRAKATAPDAVLVARRSSTSGAQALSGAASQRQLPVMPKRPARRRRPSMAFCLIALLAGAAGGMLVDDDGPTPRTAVRVAVPLPSPSNPPCFESASQLHVSCNEKQPQQQSLKHKRPLPPAT